MLFKIALTMALAFAQVHSSVIKTRPGTVKILEYIHVKNPIVWNVTVLPDGSKSKFTVIDTALWEGAATYLGGDLVPVTESKINKRINQESYDCYKSGSWAFLDTLNTYINDACNVFGGSSAGAGSTLIWTHDGKNIKNDDMTIYYIKNIVNGGPDNGWCWPGLSDLLWKANCPTGNRDTLGADHFYYQDGNLMVKYTIDPQTWNCNC